jgi:hypothetical protein
MYMCVCCCLSLCARGVVWHSSTMQLCACTYVCVCVRVVVWLCACTCVCLLCECVRVLWCGVAWGYRAAVCMYMCVCVLLCECVCVCACGVLWHGRTLRLRACMCVCMCVCVCVCVSVWQIHCALIRHLCTSHDVTAVTCRLAQQVHTVTHACCWCVLHHTCIDKGAGHTHSCVHRRTQRHTHKPEAPWLLA